MYLQTVTTSATDIDEVQTITTTADDEQTLGGGFRLHYGDTPHATFPTMRLLEQ